MPFSMPCCDPKTGASKKQFEARTLSVRPAATNCRNTFIIVQTILYKIEVSGKYSASIKITEIPIFASRKFSLETAANYIL